MITRRAFAERKIRQYYGGFPTDDAQLTPNLINTWINEGIALAAKTNYKENEQVEGVGFVNDSFSTSYKNITVTADPFEVGKFQAVLPSTPIGIGENQGLERVVLTDKSYFSKPAILITIREVDFLNYGPQPDGVFVWNEGNILGLYSPMYPSLTDFTIKATMISGGDSTNLDANLNLPDDYMPIVNDYVEKQLFIMKNGKQDTANDGNDKP